MFQKDLQIELARRAGSDLRREIAVNDVVIVHKTFDLGLGDKNPMDHVFFYGRGEFSKPEKIPLTNVRGPWWTFECGLPQRILFSPLSAAHNASTVRKGGGLCRLLQATGPGRHRCDWIRAATMGQRKTLHSNYRCLFFHSIFHSIFHFLFHSPPILISLFCLLTCALWFLKKDLLTGYFSTNRFQMFTVCLQTLFSFFSRMIVLFLLTR